MNNGIAVKLTRRPMDLARELSVRFGASAKDIVEQAI